MMQPQCDWKAGYIDRKGRPSCRCQRRGCGNQIPQANPALCDARCKAGLGAMLAAMLKSWGVKKQPGCGCDERQRDLDQFGGRHPIIAKTASKLLDWLTRKP